MKNLIEEMVVDYHKNCSVDGYGQVGTLRVYSVFKDKMDDVLEYAKNDNTLIEVSTYGGRLGTFKGFQITDSNLRKKCSEALRSNHNYKEAMTSW
jgi:hypothetical protein